MTPGNSYRILLIPLVLAVGILISLTRCANPVAPTGGPKDVTPPSVTEADPPNYSVRFKEKKIHIEFDEFIQLKDQSKEIFISPPMATQPEFTVRGKSLVIELQDNLRENMTYVINFGSAIVDITESNPLKGFSYVLSTGNVIDSLEISGYIVNSSDLKPSEEVLFVIYSPRQDSIPQDSLFRKVQPLSAVRTSSDGSFHMTNLPGGSYLAYGLEDMNNNFYYDLPTEKIAFLDSLVTPGYIEVRKDTVDTTNTEALTELPPAKPPQAITLYLFQEFDSVQRILSSSLTPEGSIMFAFRVPVHDIDFIPLNFDEVEDWQVTEYNLQKDTLFLWPRDYSRDTFELYINIGDTILDTTTFIRRDDTRSGTGRRKNRSGKALSLNLNTKAGVLAPGKDLVLTSNEPLSFYDFTGVRLYTKEDTIQPEVDVIDEIGRKFIIRNEWEEDQRYGVYIPDSIMKGFSGASNDSARFTIMTKSLEEYGTFIMSYELPSGDSNYIIELLNEKEAVIHRDTLTASEEVTYRYLKPGNYHIKLIVDENKNGKWDTGILHMKLPEKVLYFGKEITIRSNWELTDEWQPVE